MTTKQQRHMKALEMEIALLKEKLDHHFEVYRTQLYEIVDYKLIIATATDALRDALSALEGKE